jgi:HEAT repeat protein
VVRVAAARALGAIGDDSPIPHLVKAAQTTGWDTLHSWVTSTLVELRAAEAAPHLLKRLQAPRSWQGRWAARELGTIGGMSALEPLRAARRRDLLHWLVYSRAIRQVERRGAWAA